MRICIISNLYPPYARGGAEQVVYKIVEELGSLGHSIVIITLTPEKEGKEALDGVTIYRIHPRNLFFYTDAHHHNFLLRAFWHIFDIFNFDSRRKIQKILQEEKPDIVHTHNLMGLGFLIPKLLRFLKIPHVHTIHDVQLVEPSGIILKSRENSWRYRGFPTRLYTFIMKFLMGSPHVVISPSQFLLQFYEKKGFFQDSKRLVMRNPSTFSYDLTPTKKDHGGVCRFLAVGQIEEHKGFRFLVETFLEFLKRENAQAELIVVGSGSLLEELQRMTKGEECIQFLGKIDRQALPDIFAGADFTVVPSLCYENSPTVIFESLFFGVPVLASRIEGIVELIREGENGMTFVSGDKNSLLQKLHVCTQEKGKLSPLGTKDRILLGQGEEYGQKLLALFEKIVKRF